MISLEQPGPNEQKVRTAQADRLYQTAVMLMCGRRKSVEKAIKCIQRAIAFDDKSYKYWQLLGEAYYQRGSLNPAINCFLKSLSLADALLEQQDSQEDRTRIQSDSVYSRLRMSDIRLSVQQVDEAMSGYGDIISADPENVAALVGMSKAELVVSRHCFHNGLIKSGHLHCMNALKFSLRATKLSPHLCSTWKLASDCCLIQILYGQRGDFATRIDLAEFPGCNRDGLVVTRASCIELAQQFLCKALSIDSFHDSSCLWHNLGISLYLESTFPSRTSDEREKLLKRSLKCLLKSLDHDRTSSQVRNSIGIVAHQLNLLSTSQSFLIKSIQTNKSTSEIQFSNLGYIFLQRGELKLASVAFNRCQAEEPLYCRSWLGNAIVNERNNLDNMSLLRHCHKLENNHESQMMYATKVVGLPHREEYHKDLVNAMDCMKRMINYDRQCLAAQNTLGLLYERCNLIDQAEKCSDDALKLAPDDSRVIFNKLRQLVIRQTATTQCVGDPAMGHSTPYAELIMKAEKLAQGGNLEHMLNLVFYLFNNRDFATMDSRMKRIAESIPDGNNAAKLGAQVLLAMAHRAQGGDFKSLLVKSASECQEQVCVESVISLFSLMLFSSISDDQQLVDQCTDNLAKCLISYLSTKCVQFSDSFYSLEGLWLRLTLACSIFCQKKAQSKLMSIMLALYPTIAELWLFQGISLMLLKKPRKNRTAIYCLDRARLIGSTNVDLCMVCEILLAILVYAPSPKPGKNMPKSVPDPKERFTLLSKALFKCPSNQLLRDCCLESQRPQGKAGPFRDADLFQLAIDHTLKTIVAYPRLQLVVTV